MSATPLTHTADLAGRDAECAASNRPLDEVRAGRGAVLVVRGEARIGKSAMPDYTTDRASGFGVAQASRTEAGGDLPFAGAQRLLEPMVERVQTLTAPQRDALNAAIGGPVPDPFLVALAVLSLAISNREARAELAASRRRLAAASFEERRRVVRDLHDGAQQRLVHTVISLKLAREALLERGDTAGAELLDEPLAHARQATDELRELAHGILPAVLAQGGLRAAVESLAMRSHVPIAIDVLDARLPAPVEATAYFVVAEALTNIAKHAAAEHVLVSAATDGGVLRVDVRDDGRGGARTDGAGLVGLSDRLAALDGRLRIESPAGKGTHIAAEIPLTPVADAGARMQPAPRPPAREGGRRATRSRAWRTPWLGPREVAIVEDPSALAASERIVGRSRARRELRGPRRAAPAR